MGKHDECKHKWGPVTVPCYWKCPLCGAYGYKPKFDPQLEGQPTNIEFIGTECPEELK